jgi:hypothetical protein
VNNTDSQATKPLIVRKTEEKDAKILTFQQMVVRLWWGRVGGLAGCSSRRRCRSIAGATVSLRLLRKGAAYALPPSSLLPLIVASDEPPQLASLFWWDGTGESDGLAAAAPRDVSCPLQLCCGETRGLVDQT